MSDGSSVEGSGAVNLTGGSYLPGEVRVRSVGNHNDESEGESEEDEQRRTKTFRRHPD